MLDERRESQGKPEHGAQQVPAGSAVRYEEVLMREAYEKMNSGKLEEAAHIFEDVLKRFSDALDNAQHKILNTELATIFYWLGEYDDARHCAERARSLPGSNDQAYVMLGKIALAEYRFTLARQCFNQVSSAHPGHFLGHALVAIKLRETEKAQHYLNNAHAVISLRDPEYIVLSAYVLLLQGQTHEGVSAAREFEKKDVRDPALILLLAEIFMTAGNYGEAQALATNVMRMCPNNDHAYALKAYASYADEDFTDAEYFASESVRLNPRNAYAGTVLMKCSARRGDYEIAARIGRDILERSPEYSLGHANLGDVYFVQGRFELAQVEYEQTQELMDSQTKGARLRTARMAFTKEEYARAAEILEDLINTYHTYYDDAMCDLVLCYDKLGESEKRDEVLDKMHFRRSFYHRTEKLLQSFGEKVN